MTDSNWAHFLAWLSPPFFDSRKNMFSGYDPELWKDAFDRYQTHGRSALTSEELDAIEPLLDGQRQKEITFANLVTESMEYRSKGWGWMIPFLHWFETADAEGADRKTIDAVHKIVKGIETRGVRYYLSHPGVDQKLIEKYLKHYDDLLSNKRLELRGTRSP